MGLLNINGLAGEPVGINTLPGGKRLGRMLGLLVVACLPVFAAGCAGAPNQAMPGKYSAACAEAGLSGRADVAEKACTREMEDAGWNTLGAEQKSQKLYNLARIKEQLSKYPEAEDLLRASLAIEERLSPPSPVRIARRLIALAVNVAAQGRWERGVYYLDRAVPLARELTGQERAYLSRVLSQYARKLREWNQAALAERYEATASALR